VDERHAGEFRREMGRPDLLGQCAVARENHLVLIERHRERLAAHGHDPWVGYVESGSGGLFLADTDEEAVRQYRPIYEARARKLAAAHAGDIRQGKTMSMRTIEDAVAHSLVLVGTPEQVAARSLIATRATGTTCNRSWSSQRCRTPSSATC
jgi:alkanesulfonate monooxygenase SsuD/methylene tetrahydromethanopterin reductase-like flavin-dependent oxidoreductase (luciferase family)